MFKKRALRFACYEVVFARHWFLGVGVRVVQSGADRVLPSTSIGIGRDLAPWDRGRHWLRNYGVLIVLLSTVGLAFGIGASRMSLKLQ